MTPNADVFRITDGGVMSCIACTIQNHLITTLASGFVVEFLVRVSKLYKYVAYFV